MTDIIDLAPRIRRKRMPECTHESVEVDDTAASLTCADCEVELDPWWWLRRQAHDHEAEQKRQAKAQAQLDEWLRTANEKCQALHAEIVRLTEAKNRLWNTQVDGRPLGAITKRRRG
jgi:hypothetical protein